MPRNTYSTNNIKRKGSTKKLQERANSQGKQILPKPGDKIHLSKFGYDIHTSERKRRDSLNKASKEHDTLEILRRLNLLRNYQSDKDNKEIMTQDVEFMKRKYANIKKGSKKGSR
jgi:hypothetical protein